MKPEEFIGEKVTYDKDSQRIFGHKGGKIQLLLDVRGWGAMQNIFRYQEDAADFQDELGQWFADAINEKLTQPKELDLFRQYKKAFDAGFDYRTSLLPEIIEACGEDSAMDFEGWLKDQAQPIAEEIEKRDGEITELKAKIAEKEWKSLENVGLDKKLEKWDVNQAPPKD